MKASLWSAATALGLLSVGAQGLEVQWDNPDSVRETAATIAWGLVRYYSGNNTGDVPGNLPDPYYWWECGAMFGTLVDYWYITGDDSYNDIAVQAMVHQAGPDQDFMPENQTLTLGNDDQGFWAMSAMSAAENVFPNPPEDQPQWLAITQAIFNEWVDRWEPEVCGGGLRWQIFPGNNGYTFKNTISNGCFFNIAARLARYTGNDTYAEWANKIFDWHVEYEIFTDEWHILDGLHLNRDGTGGNCDKIDLIQWSYNIGIFLHGSAVMSDYTGEDKWKTRVDGMLEHVQEQFFRDGVVFEQFCEEHELCNLDQRSFKGYLTRWLGWTSRFVPETADIIAPLIQSSGDAAMISCTGTPSADAFKGHPGTACGFKWVPEATFDGLTGVGEQMNALDVVMYNLISDVDLPATADNGGTSKGNPGGGKSDAEKTVIWEPLTTGDRVGAGFLTTLALVGLLAGCTFLILN